jgi:hypothetical protein
MTLYRVTGTVTAPDGTQYTPMFWGSWHTAGRVMDAITQGAQERSESVLARIDTGPGTRVIARVLWAPQREEQTA